MHVQHAMQLYMGLQDLSSMLSPDLHVLLCLLLPPQ
jgi:hypothetical protein